MSNYYDNASDDEAVTMSEDDEVCDSASHYSSVTSWSSLRANTRPKDTTFGMGGAAAALREGAGAWSAMGALQALSQAQSATSAATIGDNRVSASEFVAAARHVADGEGLGEDHAQPAETQQQDGLSDEALFGVMSSESSRGPPLVPPAAAAIDVGADGNGSAYVRSGDAKLVLDGSLAARWASDAAGSAEVGGAACGTQDDSAKNSLSSSPVNC